MNGCDSDKQKVTIEEKEEDSDTATISWKPFFRQFLVCSGVWTSFFMYGLCLGAPTVMIPQIKREANSTDAVSDEMASWLSSAFSISGFLCVIILSILSKHVGRKISFMLSCVDTFIAFLIFYCSTNVTQILISQIAQGLFAAAQIVISITIITEYTSPKYRGIFLTIKCATLYWGVWVANALGTFIHWKTIGLLGILCSCYILTTVFIWPESPYWLASKERYKECRASHRWLKGSDRESEKELETLISTQKEYVKDSRAESKSILRTLKYWYTNITAREFYKPVLIAILSGILIIISGKMVCIVYALDILQKITTSESTAYNAMLILDGITVLSMYFGCVLSKFLNRRTLLLIASSLASLFLFLISLYLYLIHLNVLLENKYLSVGLLLLFTIFVSCGPLVMSGSVYGELVPLRSRNLAMCIIAMCGKFLMAVLLKVAPYIFKAFGLHGTFLFFGISSAICILLLYIYLPETKDKTLQEIADSMTGITAKDKRNIEEGLLMNKNIT